MRAHIHVHSRARCLLAGLCVVCRNAVNDAFLDRIGIAHDKALESQLFLQDVAQQIFVHRAGNAVQIIEGCHSCRSAFLHRCPESRQVDIVQL